MKNLRFLQLVGCLCLLAFQSTLAGSATWRLNPVTSDWNTASNWTPATVPGSGDIASFDVSNQPTVTLSANTGIKSIVFNAGASSYNTTVPTGITFTITNGITNNSGVAQDFVIDHGSLVFNLPNEGNAGQLTNYLLNGSGSAITFNSGYAYNGTFTIEGGGQVLFNNSSSTRSGNTFTLEGNGDGVPGLLQFSGNADATGAIINLHGNGAGANCVFLGDSSSGSDTFNVDGADSAAHGPGVLTFAENSSDRTKVGRWVWRLTMRSDSSIRSEWREGK